MGRRVKKWAMMEREGRGDGEASVLGLALRWRGNTDDTPQSMTHLTDEVEAFFFFRQEIT